MKQILLLSLLLVIFSTIFAQSNQWTWMSGDIAVEQYGIYGIKGVASATNKPGARTGAVSWSDASSNLWLFGGYGFASLNSSGYMNDLWKYNITSGLWTWVSGDAQANLGAINGTRGIPNVEIPPNLWTKKLLC